MGQYEKRLHESLMSDIADILKEAIEEAGLTEKEEPVTYSVVAEGKVRPGKFNTINEARKHAERLYDRGARGEIMVVNNKTRDVVDEFVD